MKCEPWSKASGASSRTTAAKAAGLTHGDRLANVRFSNRPIEVALRLSAGTVSMSLVGSRFSSDSAQRPWDFEDQAECGPRFTISLKRNTKILQLSTSWKADYPILSRWASAR